ncbi:KIR-like protein [Plasmodium coatneyi]|uniref:KIR-like protein n=1 Tax=Plasmodium coatneyi TaxID=208452 RepID=A0A1B1E6U3_9APIC|nr:KIR-like protein [Plasmodium coatneyi]ANQ10721.1 KIR-like protein [Plasmodium coatneyi]
MSPSTPKEKLERLPSYNDYYKKFNEKKGNCDGNKSWTTVKGELDDYRGIQNYAERIVKALCYVLKMEAGHNLYQERWNFFYYWLGDIFSKNLREASGFESDMDKIYEDLKPMITDTPECKNLYPNIDRDKFSKMKTIFDYSYDYNTIEKDLQNVESNCNGDQWSTYRQKVTDACEKLHQYCAITDSKNGPYCDDFKDKYKVYCEAAKLPKLQCELKSVQERMEHQAAATTKEKNDAVRQATTTSSISSIFGTLATIGTPFLLYKYKPSSSWFGNHSTGRRRGKRSAEREIETLTESSTTDSILDACENSTVGSGAYNARQSTGGRRNNNTRGRGMVRYQNV